MAEEKNIKGYYKEYSENLFNKVGNSFSFSAFIEKSNLKKIRPTGLTSNYYPEVINFPWLDELEMVTEKIMSIASKPRTHIKVEKDVKKAEQAVKIDNSDIIATLKVPSYWKRKGDRFLPEKVFTDIFEIEYAIYENRFIINLVDKMMLFLSQIVAQLYSKIKNINDRFIDSHIQISDIEIIQDLADFETFKYVPASSKRSKRIRDKEATLLTTKDSPYVDALRRILQSRSNVAHVRSTPFYKDVKKAKPLSDTDVHLTNMLAGDPSYAPCYNFYLKLLSLMTKDIDVKEPVDLKDYHNYVLANLFSALNDLGFSEPKRTGGVNNKNRLLTLDKYRLSKGEVACYITSMDEDHIDIKFDIDALDGTFSGSTNFKNKSISTISLDLVPDVTSEYPNPEELSEYFKKKINSRILSGYTNAFIITAVDNTQKDDVIICSPEVYKIDANIRSMLESCIIFAEGDNYVYAHVCPICGFYVDGEQEDGNCYCANCDSAYSLLKSGKGNEVKESVWIKRLKNPEKI